MRCEILSFICLRRRLEVRIANNTHATLSSHPQYSILAYTSAIIIIYDSTPSAFNRINTHKRTSASTLHMRNSQWHQSHCSSPPKNKHPRLRLPHTPFVMLWGGVILLPVIFIVCALVTRKLNAWMLCSADRKATIQIIQYTYECDLFYEMFSCVAISYRESLPSIRKDGQSVRFVL